MSIGTALVVIAVLYLIDRHGLWRVAASIGGGVLVLAGLGLGSWYGYTKYQVHETAAAFQQKVDDCQSRLTKAAEARFSDLPAGATAVSVPGIRAACENNPDTRPCPAVTLPPGYEDAKPVDDPSCYDVGSKYDIEPATPKTQPKPAPTHVVALFDTYLTTTAGGGLNCCQLKKGDVLTLLTEGSAYIKVRTADGKTGWGWADFFEIQKAPAPSRFL